ncbi:hypothetical protein [Mucilaginibacter gracilis]|nr:hypothetical protein [Mucilaginibacter gracilis]
MAKLIKTTHNLFMEKFMKLSRVAMKNVLGGNAPVVFVCKYIGQDGKSHNISFTADNADAAQGAADYVAYSDAYSQTYPSGIDCPGATGAE